MPPVVNPVSVICLIAAINNDNPPHVLGSLSLFVTAFMPFPLGVVCRFALPVLLQISDRCKFRPCWCGFFCCRLPIRPCVLCAPRGARCICLCLGVQPGEETQSSPATCEPTDLKTGATGLHSGGYGAQPRKGRQAAQCPGLRWCKPRRCGARSRTAAATRRADRRGAKLPGGRRARTCEVKMNG